MALSCVPLCFGGSWLSMLRFVVCCRMRAACWGQETWMSHGVARTKVHCTVAAIAGDGAQRCSGSPSPPPLPRYLGPSCGHSFRVFPTWVRQTGSQSPSSLTKSRICCSSMTLQLVTLIVLASLAPLFHAASPVPAAQRCCRHAICVQLCHFNHFV